MACVAFATLAVPTRLPAQADAGELAAQGVAAYRALEVTQAARLLQEALGVEGAGALGDSARVDALLYLGAAQLYRDDREATTNAFREAILLRPGIRPDSLTFPIHVRQAFDEVRESVKATDVRVSPRSVFVAGRERMAIAVSPTSFHDVDVTIRDRRGGLVREIYRGPIRDRLILAWDGLDEDGAAVRAGAYTLVVESHVTPAVVLRSVRVGLRIARARQDTVRMPPRPILLPEREGHGTLAATAVPAVGAGLAVAVVPQLVSDTRSSTARFALGGALALGGIVAYLAGRHRIPANVEENERRRQAWQAQAAGVRRENRQLAEQVQLAVVASPPRRAEGGG